MSNLDIRRVVVACDAQDEIDTAVRCAAALAARWGVPLHGVFLENENLRRLAALPFGPLIRLSPGAPQRLGDEELDRMFSALAAGMRRALARAAMVAQLDWSFAELRDVPGAAGAALGAGDILVLEAEPRAVAGSWRPRSAWESVARGLGPMVLLRRGGKAGHRVILLISAGEEDHACAFEAALALAEPTDKATVLSMKRAESLPAASLALPPGLRDAAVEPIRNGEELRRRIAGIAPRLVVVETAALRGEALQALIDETSCDLLLIG